MSIHAVQTYPLQKALTTLDLPGLDDNLFSSADWMTVLDKTYRLNLFVKVIERDGRANSSVFYSVVKNFLEWKVCLCSFCDYCDAKVKSLDDWQTPFASLRDEYPQYRIAVRNMKDELIRRLPQIKELSREKCHVLDIREDLPVVWRRAHDSFKAAVRQAERFGVQVRPCTKDELKDFYQSHLLVRRHKYRVFPQPLRFFEIIWDQYIAQDKGVLLGAFDKEGRFIGANMYLICANTLYYKFNTSRQEALKLRPNNILFWAGVKYAKEQGLDFVDLGSSGLHQKGLILYKDHTGAEQKDIIHLGFAPEGYRFSEKRILKLFTKICTLPGMPDAVVRWGSEIIYPYLA